MRLAFAKLECLPGVLITVQMISLVAYAAEDFPTQSLSSLMTINPT